MPLNRALRGLAVFCLATAAPYPALACEGAVSVCTKEAETSFLFARAGAITQIRVDPSDAAPVRHAAKMLAEDIGRVTGTPGMVGSGDVPSGGPVIMAGTLDSPAIATLVRSGALDVAQIRGTWEGYVQAIVPAGRSGLGVPALVIAGSDPRGAVYGLLDLSERIGVSPWHWWADVPVQQKQNVWLTAGTRADAPAVKYRGFFINDEDPAFGGWANEKFGGVNAQAYEHVFDLLLRLKGNYIWPAMWGKSLPQDDPASLALAAETGVVLGTSHHEPLTRAHVEWDRAKAAGEASGEWNYGTNAAALRNFWQAGMQRHVASGAEAVVTIGMRGDGDEAMSEDTAIPLLEQVVADQRTIIAEATGKPASQTPQVWALYKEVQDYYDQGMQVPDDVTLLFADDNWGQIRRLPALGAAPRQGGYGVYYHFDYVGGPRSYKWIDTIQNGKTWQQMNLAWERGARDLWIVNVGDIKPAEFPLDFFLDMAWDPVEMTPDALGDYSRAWATQQFGAANAGEIAEILDEYARLVSRRKPELLDADALPLRELGAASDEWGRLAGRTTALAERMPEAQRPAFAQLVLHRVLAVGNLYRLYHAVAQNRQLAEQGSPQANDWADRAEQAFEFDRMMTDSYHAIAGGKWNHMMSQPHIGYSSWDDPDENIMPELVRVEATSRPSVRLTPEPISAATAAADVDAAPVAKGLSWQPVAEIGSHGSALVALPQGRPATTPADGVYAEYTLMVPFTFRWQLDVELVPTLDTIGEEGLRFGVQFGDGPVEEKRFYLEATNGQYDNPDQVAWNEAVIDNKVVVTQPLGLVEKGEHRVRIYRIDDNVVLDGLVLRPIRAE